MDSIDKRRIKVLNYKESVKGPVVYWMSCNQRVQDNCAMLYAQQLSIINRTHLIVIFCLYTEYPNANISVNSPY